MKYTDKVLTVTFTAQSPEESKEAYLAACRWLAVNVISKQDEFGDVQFNIKKSIVKKLPTFTLTLYTVLDEEEEKDRFCKVCQEFNGLFFMAGWDCNKCNVNHHRNRLFERIKIKAEYIKEKLKRTGVWYN